MEAVAREMNQLDPMLRLEPIPGNPWVLLAVRPSAAWQSSLILSPEVVGGYHKCPSCEARWNDWMEECRVDDERDRAKCARCSRTREACVECKARLEGWIRAAEAHYPVAQASCRKCLGTGEVPGQWACDLSWSGFVLMRPEGSTLRVGDVSRVEVEDYSPRIGFEPVWLHNPAATLGVRQDTRVDIGDEGEFPFLGEFAALVLMHEDDLMEVDEDRPPLGRAARAWEWHDRECPSCDLQPVRGVMTRGRRSGGMIVQPSGLVETMARCDMEVVVASDVEGIEPGDVVLPILGTGSRFTWRGSNYVRYDRTDLLLKGALAWQRT